MKTATRLFALLCLSLIFSCGRESLEQNDSPSPYLTLGQWRVRANNNAAASASLSGYDLRFLPDGRLSCTQAGVVTEGSWSMHQKVEGRSVTLRVHGQASGLSELNNDWNLGYFDPNTVNLDQGNQHLTLSRP